MGRAGGKVALSTGAGTGIGRATARAMAAEGAKVVVAEINAEAGEQTAQILAQDGGDCIAVATDVTQQDSVRAAIDAAVRHYGGLHILHNNAGGSTPVDSTVVEVPIEEFWRATRLDLSMKRIANFWPYATTLYDYTRRAMPWQQPMTLANDEVYALNAYILAANKLIGENDTMNAQTLPKVRMPNRDGFIVRFPDAM